MTHSRFALEIHRRWPVGAEVQEGNRGVHFRVWAPKAKAVSVRIASTVSMRSSRLGELEREKGGYFSALIPGARAGMHYRYVLNGGEFPDPASRFQPEGPHGPSRIVDSKQYAWRDANWRGVQRHGHVIYELHIGTFTPEGTLAAAGRKLEYLRDLGVTLIEVMPVAEFPGRFGWGYDGVNLYAPTRLYGEPDDFRHFVDRAHAIGLGVILDVVYNHLGPDGNYLGQYSAHYFRRGAGNEWGDSINFDGKHCGPVREFFIANAAYWIDEFHLDGLRLDATHQIFDGSEEHFVAAVVRRAREVAGTRGVYIVSENAAREVHHVREKADAGYEADAIWSDDLHHTAIVALGRQRETYLRHFAGAAQEFVSGAKWGFLFQGQPAKERGERHGEPALDVVPEQFITFLQNHDQVANTMLGRRIQGIANVGQVRALTAWLLLGPGTPMLFQGQEFMASSPFYFFADHHAELADAVARGRTDLAREFPSLMADESLFPPPRPESRETFVACVLNWSERTANAGMLALHRDLIALRRSDPLITKARRGTFDGAVLSEFAFMLRYFADDGEDRLLVVNLGESALDAAMPEPLLASPMRRKWKALWTSNDARYDCTDKAKGGFGAASAGYYVAKKSRPRR